MKDMQQSESKDVQSSNAGLKELPIAKIARAVGHRAAILATRGQTDEDVFEFNLIRAVKPLLEKNNFNQLNEMFNNFVASYNASEQNALSKKYSVTKFLKAKAKNLQDAPILAQARYDFLMYCCQKMAASDRAEDKNLAKVIAQSVAWGLSLDDSHHAARVEGSFETELSNLIIKFAKIADSAEKKAKEPSSNPGLIAMIDTWEDKIKEPSQKEKANIFVKALNYVITSISSAWSSLFTKKEQVEEKAGLSFDKQDFIAEHRKHLPSMVALFNHILSQDSLQDKEAQESLYGVFKIAVLKKTPPPGTKKFGDWVDTLILHLKKEPLENLTDADKEAVISRNNARDHVLDILIHNLIPSLKKSENQQDFQKFRDGMAVLVQNMERKFDLMKLTPEMIEIIRKPEHQRDALNIVDIGLFKALKYTTAQLEKDTNRNNSAQEQALQLAPVAVSASRLTHCATDVVKNLFNSDMSSEDISKFLEDMSLKSKKPFTLISDLFVIKDQTQPAGYLYNDSLITQLSYEQPASMLRLTAKIALKVLLKGNSQKAASGEEQLVDNLWDAFKDNKAQLQHLMKGLADVSVGIESQDLAIAQRGMRKIVGLLPLLSEKVFQAEPPNMLVTIFAAKLLPMPKNKEGLDEAALQNLQVAFIRALVDNLSKNTVENQQAWADTFSSVLMATDKKASILSKMYNFFSFSTAPTVARAVTVIDEAYKALDSNNQQLMAQHYPTMNRITAAAGGVVYAAEVSVATAAVVTEYAKWGVGYLGSAIANYFMPAVDKEKVSMQPPEHQRQIEQPIPKKEQEQTSTVYPPLPPPEGLSHNKSQLKQDEREVNKLG